MNNRDRLVELITSNPELTENLNISLLKVFRFADHLLENGATFKKHGEWLLLDECSNEGVYCSVCRKKVYDTHYANQKIKSKFCPNCGARMDGQAKGGVTNDPTTDNEIIKAFEKHWRQVCNGYYEHISYGCERDTNEEEYIYMLYSVFELIKRQQAEIEELDYKLGALLCYVTNGKLSKSTYSLQTMESTVDDAITDDCNDAKSEAVKEFVSEFNKALPFGLLSSTVVRQITEDLLREKVGADNE